MYVKVIYIYIHNHPGLDRIWYFPTCSDSERVCAWARSFFFGFEWLWIHHRIFDDFPLFKHGDMGICDTLWKTYIAIEHGHRNSGFTH